jgi:uncharacterized protein involved in exopolysaccharide biosynthesis
MQATRPLSPAERCLRTIWADRLPFLAIVALGVAAAAAITAAQPTLYRSQTLLSVKPPPEIVSEAIRTKRPYLGPDGHIYDANDPERQTGPGRYAPRLVAPGLVTAAARDAGILSADTVLDDQRAAQWATAERIEGADLIRLSVWQPTPDAAQKLAAAIVARGLEINRRDEAAVPEPELRRILVLVDPPTQPSAPAYPRRAVNLSVGFALGVLAASAVVAVRSATRRAPL